MTVNTAVNATVVKERADLEDLEAPEAMKVLWD